jgi:hypothetical protein
MRIRHRMTGGVAAVLLLLAGVQTAGATAASADTGCWRDTCTGKDPYTMGCDADAEVLDQYDAGTDVEIKLVWSPACQADWAKVTIDPGYTDPVHAELWYTPTLGGIEKSYPTVADVSSTHTSSYSLMGNWKATNKACYSDQDSDFDPEPLRYEEDGHDASLPLQHGACTDWI